MLADLDPMITARHLPVPRLIGTAEYGPWFALIIDDLTGHQPAIPWRDTDLDLVLAALGQLVESLTPAPVEVPGIAEVPRR